MKKIKELDIQNWLEEQGYSADEAYTAEELLEAVELFRDFVVKEYGKMLSTFNPKGESK